MNAKRLSLSLLLALTGCASDPDVDAGTTDASTDSSSGESGAGDSGTTTATGDATTGDGDAGDGDAGDGDSGDGDADTGDGDAGDGDGGDGDGDAGTSGDGEGSLPLDEPFPERRSESSAVKSGEVEDASPGVGEPSRNARVRSRRASRPSPSMNCIV